MKSGILAAALALFLSGTHALGQTNVYSVVLDGLSESPPNASPGTGVGTVTLDLGLQTMRVQTNFSGLIGNVTNAHIHCCTAAPNAGIVGVATPTPTFPGFPAGGTSGVYDATFDMTLASSYNAAFVTANGGTVAAAFTALTAGMDSGRAYLNIHSTQFSGGEIRGFLQLVPEPISGSLAAIVAGGLLALGRRRLEPR